jgi:hypothetical protein
VQKLVVLVVREILSFIPSMENLKLFMLMFMLLQFGLKLGGQLIDIFVLMT